MSSNQSDLEFERALLEAGRADELPHADTPRAWARFAAESAVTMAALPARLGAAPIARAAAAARAARGGAAKWLVAGVLGGSVVTAGLMEWRHPGAPALAPAAVVSSPPAARQGEPPPPVDRARIAAPELKETDAIAPLGSTAPGTRARAAARRREAGAADLPSTLGAEVAALDAAREAAAAGDPDEALRLVDRYRYDFPAGELAADAEVVAIEALVAKGDHAEATRRAERFLARAPHDPHAAEVRRLGR